MTALGANDAVAGLRGARSEAAAAPAPMRGAPELVVTKLQPPPGRDQLVERARLFERLEPTPGVRLTVLAAPTGYGKTTLLTTWRDARAAERPVAWLTLDEGDNDELSLWSHVVGALNRVHPGVDVPYEPDRADAAQIQDVVLPRLVNRLAEEGDMTLVLDDFHVLSGAAARDGVVWLAEHAPPTFQLVVASRTEPSLRLPALRAHGELVEIRADELAFTAGEAEALLDGSLGLGLARADIAELVRRTEGWPAGLYLAALSLRGVDDRAEFIRRFGGTSRPVVDFLVDEVLEAHDPALQTLMLRCAVLDELYGPLCDAVLEQDGTGSPLAELSRSNLFLLPLDERGDRYRFHKVFAQLLRVELQHREPGAVAELHRRAYRWQRDHGLTDDAIEHALEAGAYVEARDLIADSWVTYVNAGKARAVLGWLERIPSAVRQEDALLLTVEAWTLSLCGRRRDAARAIEGAERRAQREDGPLRDGFSSVEASLATLRGSFPGDDVGAALKDAKHAAELERPGSPHRPAICGAIGVLTYLSGGLDEADEWFEQASNTASSVHQWLIAGSLAWRSLIAGELGRPDEQHLLAEEAARLAGEHGLEDVGWQVHLALGVARLADGRHVEARRLLDQALDVLRPSGQPLHLAQALIRQASVLHALGERDRMPTVVAEARSILESCPAPGAVLPALLDAVAAPPRRRSPRSGTLTDRERAILRCLTGSLSARDIGRELYLSHNTIHSHITSIYRKLGVSSRADAIEEGRALGLV